MMMRDDGALGLVDHNIGGSNSNKSGCEIEKHYCNECHRVFYKTTAKGSSSDDKGPMCKDALR